MPRPMKNDSVSLTLRIGDTNYDVQLLAGSFRLRKIQGSGAYHVARSEVGFVECTCPDFVQRGRAEWRMCKHGRALIALGLIPPLVTPNPEASSCAEVS